MNDGSIINTHCNALITYVDVPLMRRTEIINLLPLAVVKESPVLIPTEKPAANEIAPAEDPFVTKTSKAQSTRGVAKLCAPLFV